MAARQGTDRRSGGWSGEGEQGERDCMQPLWGFVGFYSVRQGAIARL